MHMLVKISGLAFLILLGPSTIAFAQTSAPAQQSTQDYEQRVSKALDTAKKSADALNQRHTQLLEAIRNAKDPAQAEKVLDELIKSAASALEAFGEQSEMMQAVDGLLSFIETRRKNAEQEFKTDEKWGDRVNAWKTHAENIRTLRQALLGEADRAKTSLERLTKERKFIEDVIAGEGVEKARAEMMKALADLKQLGDSLDKAVNEAQRREKAVPAF
jgi:quinol monooxygenase YgiN